MLGPFIVVLLRAFKHGYEIFNFLANLINPSDIGYVLLDVFRLHEGEHLLSSHFRVALEREFVIAEVEEAEKEKVGSQKDEDVEESVLARSVFSVLLLNPTQLLSSYGRQRVKLLLGILHLLVNLGVGRVEHEELEQRQGLQKPRAKHNAHFLHFFCHLVAPLMPVQLLWITIPLLVNKYGLI